MQKRIESIYTAKRGLIKDLGKSYPGASEAAVSFAAEKVIALAAEHDDAAKVVEAFENLLAESAANGEAWATVLRDAVLSKARPAYDKARKVGVDPVPVIQAETGMTKEEAEQTAAKFDAEKTAAQEDNGADDIEPVDYGSENPDSDSRAY